MGTVAMNILSAFFTFDVIVCYELRLEFTLNLVRIVSLRGTPNVFLKTCLMRNAKRIDAEVSGIFARGN